MIAFLAGLAAGLLGGVPVGVWLTRSRDVVPPIEIPPPLRTAPPVIVPIHVGGPSRYRIVSDAGVVRFPHEAEDATDGVSARKAWEAVRENPDGQVWTFWHDGAVRGRVGVVS